jgi:hypothetical protein
MNKILPISFSASNPRPQSYGKVDFNCLAAAITDDGIADYSELAKRIKEQFFISKMNKKDNRYLLTRDSSWFWNDGGSAANLQASDENIFLDKWAVEFIEEHWLNGYRFPQSLYSLYGMGTGRGATMTSAMQLDKLINHLLTVIHDPGHKRIENVGAPCILGFDSDDLKYFFDHKTGG